MDRLLPLLSFLLLAAAVGHAALPAQLYWHSVLPNTPMPTAISDRLTPVVDEKAGTSVSVGKGGVGVNVNPGKGKPGGTTVGVGKGGVHVNVNPGKGKPGGTTVGVGKGGVGVNVDPGKGKPGGTTVGVGKGRVGVNVNQGKGKPGGTTVGVGVRKGGVGVNVNPGKGKPGGTTVGVGVGKGGVGVNVRPKGGKPPVNVNVAPFIYHYAATETQLHDDPTVALFFLEKDLHPAAKFNLRFPEATSDAATFLPRHVADSIPFSTAKLPAILDRLSVEPDSAQADAMEKTLQECEEPAVEGEKKRCVTSLESMVDFATSSLGTHDVKATSTTVKYKKGAPAARQQYTVTASGVRRQSAETELVACHPEPYAYAVFYCHATKTTKAYTVAMAGADGAAAEAVAVCHTDTSAWNPEHLAFKVLKVKPGGAAVCHFLPQGHVVWSLSS